MMNSRPGYASTEGDQLEWLRRAEGKIRGRHRMVESDTYCVDVLTQVSAAIRALESFALGLLDEHLAHCMTAAISAGGAGTDTKVLEASSAAARLVRS